VLLSQFPDTNLIFQPKGVRSEIHVCTRVNSNTHSTRVISNHVFTRENSKHTLCYISRIPNTIVTSLSFVACVTMLLVTLLDDNEARPPSIVAYLRKRNNVLLSHCCSSANVIEPREPHTCNNILIVCRN
jgi:hypothetical protein